MPFKISFQAKNYQGHRSRADLPGGVPLTCFHPLISNWFKARFGEPTEPQRLGWPHIAGGEDTLIAAPTGSGKTMAAFLACIDRLIREGLSGALKPETQVVYISPLKALSNDIQRNLEKRRKLERILTSGRLVPLEPVATEEETPDPADTIDRIGLLTE